MGIGWSRLISQVWEIIVAGSTGVAKIRKRIKIVRIFLYACNCLVRSVGIVMEFQKGQRSVKV